MSGAATAAAAVDSVKHSEWILKAVREYGIFAVMVAFFIWAGYVREGKLEERIQQNDTFIRQTLVTTIDANTKAFERFSAQLAGQK